MFKLIWIGLLSLFIGVKSYSQELYCFEKQTSLKQVQNSIQPFLLAGEGSQLDEQRHCVRVRVLSLARRDLIKKIISGQYKVLPPVTQSSNQIQRSGRLESCRLEIERVSRERTVKRKVQVGNKTKILEVREGGGQVSRSQLLLGVGKPGMFRMDGNEYYMTCNKRGYSGYEISLSLERDYGRSMLTTTITTVKNKKVNLGSMKDEIKNKNRELSLSQGLNYDSEETSLSFDYYLYIR
ncbi:hypothetical protein HBN50_13990 [Halobacteriovorax sp. GB3]|uniref:hypothetical protein n=1 Tax=Halobacteriovorax sp. GB3 TaxID=2719615 RepID=UPI00235E8F06|nr:hypothetical protein [Halobacteriovorax sp. GB3]MDD0854219.1 hypothetical protein [Halobacteriovorax sp. GB3]